MKNTSSLKTFVENQSAKNESEENNYDIPPYEKSLLMTKRTAIYRMHSYHQGKKPHEGIREYVRHYTQPGDLVLDPFCGSGSTVLAALLEKRIAIGIDISPAAIAITKGCITRINLTQYEKECERIAEILQKDMQEIYGVSCPVCDAPAVLMTTVFTTLFECPDCGQLVKLLEANEIAYNLKGVRACCPHCHSMGKIVEISTLQERKGFVPFRYEVKCERCQESHTVSADGFQASVPPDADYWYPTGPIPVGYTTRQPIANGFKSIEELFGQRNRTALATLLHRIRHSGLTPAIQAAFELAFTGIVIAMSRLQGYHRNPSFPNQIQRGTLYTPPNHREYNVFKWYLGKLKNLKSGYRMISAQYKAPWEYFLNTQSAVKMDIPDDSIDYIFTDPPYGGIVQYAEANWLWEGWLGHSTDWWPEEIVINNPRSLTEETWQERMLAVMRECYRVLKPNRWLSLCFHGSTNEWTMLQDLMRKAGFQLYMGEEVLSIETREKSQKQRTTTQAAQREFVLNYRKPNPDDVKELRTQTQKKPTTDVESTVRRLIMSFLSENPGSTWDRINDHVLNQLMRHEEMQAFDMMKVLSETARVETDTKSGKHFWYLKAH